MSEHTAAPEAPSKPTPSGPNRRGILFGAIIGVVVMFAGVLGYAYFGTSGDGTDPSAVAANESLANLIETTTFTTVDGAPTDPDPQGVTNGLVVHPIRETPVRDAPNGRPIAKVGTTQFGDTWLPVIKEEPGWAQVLLPSRPASSTGWIRSDDVKPATTPFVIKAHLGSKTLELVKDGKVVDSWPIAIGKQDTPTPALRTFLLGAITDENQNFSPVILPLGTHSPTHDSYGGGPGTVAIHTWPTDDVFGKAISEGCIRVPQDALDQLKNIPLGTLVIIDED